MFLPCLCLVTVRWMSDQSGPTQLGRGDSCLDVDSALFFDVSCHPSSVKHLGWSALELGVGRFHTSASHQTQISQGALSHPAFTAQVHQTQLNL